MLNSEAIKTYLNDYYKNPDTIEQYKLELLKDHFFDILKLYLNITRKDFLIGVNKNKNIIFFTSQLDQSIEIIYNHTKNVFYKKVNDKITIIKLSSCNNIEKINSKTHLCNNFITSTDTSNLNDSDINYNTCSVFKINKLCCIL